MSQHNVIVSAHAVDQFLKRIDTRLDLEQARDTILRLHAKSDYLPVEKWSGRQVEPHDARRLCHYTVNEQTAHIILILSHRTIITLYQAQQKGRRWTRTQNRPIR